MFSDRTPSELVDILSSKLNEISATYKLHGKKWQLTFEMQGKNDTEQKSHEDLSEYCNVQVKILRVPESSDQIAIQFKRLGGSARQFYELFDTLND
jgi:hypothetical protein